MIPYIENFVARRPRSWFIAALAAIAASAAYAAETPAKVRDYQPVFQECRGAATNDNSEGPRLAIRHMTINGNPLLLTVDPATLTTRLEREQDWSCADTDDERQKDTRYVRAVRASDRSPVTDPPVTDPPVTDPVDVIANGGLAHGATATGAFITGDLCPSRRPLDRAFLETLVAAETPLPIALSISGLWLIRHEADFAWLRAQERAGALEITWVDHSYHHPYVPGRPLDDNFLLMPGVDMRAEILDTEQLLIANGETPSVFFRFPGLISNPALMRMAGNYHLIVLGADSWLAKSPNARPGGIILVHPNGNEPAGLEIFTSLLAAGKLPLPFRPIAEVP